MRIVLIPSAFHPSLGGVEELTRQLAHQLVRDGNEVMIVTERWPRNLPRSEEFEGLKLVRFPMRVPTGHWKANLSYRLTHSRILKQLSSEIKAFRADVMHAQCVSSTTYYALLVRKKLGLPLVVTLQGELTMDANGIFDRPGMARKTLLAAAKEAEVVTACSAKTLADAQDYLQYRKPSCVTQVVFNAANTDDFARAEPWAHPKPYIFGLGRLVPQKGFEDLLAVIANSKSLLGYDLLLAGDGPSKEALESLSEKLGLKERVTFLGRTNRVQTVALFLGCEAFVLPSRADEGLPVVCAEAMAAGKPIVATRSGGTPEMIENEFNGLIVNKNSVADLQRAIERVAQDGQLATRLAFNAKLRAPEFSWPVVASQYMALYKTARVLFGSPEST